MTEGSSTFSTTSGDSYEKIMGRWSRRLAEPFLDFAGLADNGVILDAGCGTGALTTVMLARTEAAEVVGVDISSAYVAYAQEEVRSPRARFEVGDLTQLPFDDAEFEQVYSQLVLQFVPDVERAILELKRVTKPGGLIAATSWDLAGGLIFNRIFWDVAAMLDPEAEKLRQRAFTRPLTRPNELAEAWRSAGFAEVRADDLTIRTDFGSFGEYWDSFANGDGPIPAYVRQATPELRGRIEEALRRAYLGGDDDGPRSYTATAWVVSGRNSSSA
jgi:ubiquinone/menaquinone biosynthesis C-methylase UbiE